MPNYNESRTRLCCCCIFYKFIRVVKTYDKRFPVRLFVFYCTVLYSCRPHVWQYVGYEPLGFMVALATSSPWWASRISEPLNIVNCDNSVHQLSSADITVGLQFTTWLVHCEPQNHAAVQSGQYWSMFISASGNNATVRGATKRTSTKRVPE